MDKLMDNIDWIITLKRIEKEEVPPNILSIFNFGRIAKLMELMIGEIVLSEEEIEIMKEEYNQRGIPKLKKFKFENTKIKQEKNLK